MCCATASVAGSHTGARVRKLAFVRKSVRHIASYHQHPHGVFDNIVTSCLRFTGSTIKNFGIRVVIVSDIVISKQ